MTTYNWDLGWNPNAYIDANPGLGGGKNPYGPEDQARAYAHYQANKPAAATAPTGMTSDQYNQINANTAGLAGQISGVGSQVGAGFSQVNNGLTNLGNTVNNGFGQVQAGMNSGFGQVNQGLNTVGNQVANVGNKVDQGVDNINNNINQGLAGVNQNVNAGLGTVNQNITAGIGSVNNNLGTVNTNLGQVNTNMGQGFAGVNENIGKVNENIGTVDKNMAAGFTGVNQNTAQGFADQKGFLTQMNANAAAYFDQLSKGQTAAASQVGGLSSNFDAFRTQYGEDTTRQDQMMTGMQKSMDGQFNQMGQSIGAASDLATRQSNNLMASVAGAANAPQGGFGQAPAQGQAGGQANPISTSANTARQIMQTMGAQLPPEVYSQMASFASSFDEAGNLIPRTQNPDGSVVLRQPGPNGIISIRGVSPSGQVQEGVLDTNNTMGLIQRMANGR